MSSGYCSCACRDCFEIAITDEEGEPALCGECEEAGCDIEGESECCVERDCRAIIRAAKLGCELYDGRHLSRGAHAVLHTKPYVRTYCGEDLTAPGVVVYGSWAELYEGLRFMEGRVS